MPGTFATTTLSGPVLALDLGGTNARAAVVLPDGRIATRHAGSTPMAEGRAAVVDYCLGLLRAARDEHLAGGGSSPLAVGIAAPGPLYPGTGTLIDPPNLRGDWWGFPLAPAIGDALGLPWALGKDTNVNILGERDFGAGEGSGDLVYLTISTGIGGAAISGGRPIVGSRRRGRRAGAHDRRHGRTDVRLRRRRPPGGRRLRHRHRQRGPRGALRAAPTAPELARIAARIAPQPLSAVHVTEAAERGDHAAAVILERARRAVAVAVVSIVNVFGPDVVILGGGITLAWGERLIGTRPRGGGEHGLPHPGPACASRAGRARR